MPLWRHMLGAELRRLRHHRGETLGDIARRAGISPQYLSEMERGSKDASSEMIAAVAGALGVTLIDLTLAVADGLREAGGQTAAPTARAAFAVGTAVVFALAA
ncbi:helix-turn-helix protein [Leucobacter komagatae]|uniref:Helix-turn-helix protein n=2 Tax=Leucobacter komagatae TaxID=55969 RepID=A0A542Y465_9MICO|nr:helix-turn-helix protein [Leucobacter komagatae]